MLLVRLARKQLDEGLRCWRRVLSYREGRTLQKEERGSPRMLLSLTQLITHTCVDLFVDRIDSVLVVPKVPGGEVGS